MATHKAGLTAIQGAAGQELTGVRLLAMYLASTSKQRQQQFPDTARAAEIAGMPLRTLQFWIEIGAVQAIHVGRKYRVSLDSLYLYLERQLND